jgi:DNA phosphorothioation-associated putative methyltransferase
VTPAAHRTAIVRGELSRPTRLLLGSNLLKVGESFFDYGCGKGEDLTGLRELGFEANGWDPHYLPNESRLEADVVNIGYVVNVIEDLAERTKAIKAAWQQTRRILVVSARLKNELRSITCGKAQGDGVLTGHGTFQKFYSQAELRTWVDSTLGVESIAAAPGIFLVFREEPDANEYMIQNRRRRSFTVKISRSDQIYEENRELLEELVSFFTLRGRLPRRDEETALQHRLREQIGGTRRAWNVVQAASQDTNWGEISTNRRSELLVDIALLKLNRRPNFMALPEATRHDVKEFFGSYKDATAEADALLFSAGDTELVNEAANNAEVGKRLPTALYVHESALNHLAPILRVYEGCARWLVGEVDDANIIKLATDKPKVSYLSYPHFDKAPHPALRETIFVRLRNLDVDWRNYENSANYPILHRKEEFVADDYPLKERFSRLTKQEERFGLYDTDLRQIGYLDGWVERLRECGVALKGHRVVKRK